MCASKRASDIISATAARYAQQNSTYRKDFASILDISPESVFPIRHCNDCGFVFAAYALPASKRALGVRVSDRWRYLFRELSR